MEVGSALNPVMSPEQLAQAFGAFSSAAQVLEKSYFSLGQEVSRLRAELERERDLRRRREALAEISALLAHEIRNPLGSLELFTGLLSGSALPHAERSWVEQIQSGLRILSATVNNVLEFHSQSGLTLRELELNRALHSVQQLLAPLGARAGMRWESNYCAKEIWVKGDWQRLEQVFLNLALNAFRFARSGGVLRVRTECQGQSALIRFADKGPGIASEILPRIFHAGVTTGLGGTGLGLAVAKRIVEQHGGSISITSTSCGATFAVFLPLHDAETPEPAGAQGATA